MVDNRIRSSKELKKLIAEIQIEFIKANRKPPSASKITKVIAGKVKKEDILFDKFIRFR